MLEDVIVVVVVAGSGALIIVHVKLFTYPTPGVYDLDKLVVSLTSALILLVPLIKEEYGTDTENWLVAKGVAEPFRYHRIPIVEGLFNTGVIEKFTGLLVDIVKEVAAGELESIMFTRWCITSISLSLHTEQNWLPKNRILQDWSGLYQLGFSACAYTPIPLIPTQFFHLTVEGLAFCVILGFSDANPEPAQYSSANPAKECPNSWIATSAELALADAVA